MHSFRHPAVPGAALPACATVHHAPARRAARPWRRRRITTSYHNVSVGYGSGAKHAREWLRGLSVQLTVNNVFDTKPPFAAAAVRSPFFYSRHGNVRLRDYIVRVKKHF